MKYCTSAITFCSKSKYKLLCCLFVQKLIRKSNFSLKTIEIYVLRLVHATIIPVWSGSWTKNSKVTKNTKVFFFHQPELKPT